MKRKQKRKGPSLNTRYMRAMSQVVNLFHDKNLGRFVTFEQLLTEAGVNYKAKTVTEKNLKKLQKLTTERGIYSATNARHLRKRTTAEWYEMQGQLQAEFKEAKELDKYKSNEDTIIRSAYEDYKDYFQEWDNKFNRPYKYKEAYFEHIRMIEQLRYALTQIPKGETVRTVLARDIKVFERLHGTIDTDNLYEEIPKASEYIMTNFDNMMKNI